MVNGFMIDKAYKRKLASLAIPKTGRKNHKS